MELKPISKGGVASALAKAERYRLLNEPREAESICRDVLRVQPESQEALKTLLLALTDQFGKGHGVGMQTVKELLPSLQGEYEKAYYAGIILERWGKSLTAVGAPHSAGHDWLRQAMRLYEEAEAIRPSGNDDAILRWNACARMVKGRTAENGERAMTPSSMGEPYDDECPLV